MAHRRCRRRFFLSIPVENTLLLDLVDHDRSRNHISEAAILFVDCARDSADEIETNRVDCPHEVSPNAFKCRDGPPTRADHSNLGLTFPRSLAIPQNLEDGKVAPIKGEE